MRTVAEEAGLLAGFLDAYEHYGAPHWDAIFEAEGTEPFMEVSAIYGQFPVRWVVGVKQ